MMGPRFHACAFTGALLLSAACGPAPAAPPASPTSAASPAAAASSAEARDTLHAIARGAVQAYERETFVAELLTETTVAAPATQALCKSAEPVPAAVPRGITHTPSTQPGADWKSGDSLKGWRCLKIELSTSQHYRYTYSAGGPYKGPARGGPDPGPGGFEAAAEGDLNGDGKTSLFTITGKVDPTTKSVTLSPLFVDQELE
jgi:hypothetical protein